jgi:hypothetical protein
MLFADSPGAAHSRSRETASPMYDGAPRGRAVRRASLVF